MAVPTKNGKLRNTTGGAYTAQTYNSNVMGVVGSSTSSITGSLSLHTTLADNPNSFSTGPKERDSGNAITRAKKALSSGTFAYFTGYVASGISTTLSGVANTALLFMGQGTKGVTSIPEFRHDLGVKMVTAWSALSFAWVGKLANGTSKASRKMWLSADGSAVSAPSVLNTTYMFDLADGNASDIAIDNVARPTRSVPGEFVLRVDFVTAGLSGGNFFDYKPITWA